MCTHMYTPVYVYAICMHMYAYVHSCVPQCLFVDVRGQLNRNWLSLHLSPRD